MAYLPVVAVITARAGSQAPAIHPLSQVAFLSSDRVSFSTGAVYDISGGRATY